MQKNFDYYTQLYDKYNEILSKYYDFNLYLKDIEKNNIISTDYIHGGKDKHVNKIEFDNQHKYAITYINIYNNDIEIHLNILDKFFSTGGYEKYNFRIPLLYRSDITIENNYIPYVMELVDFDFTREKYFAKYIRLEKETCNSYGKFYNFIIDVCGYDFSDVESYYDNNNILYFLDFGEFSSLSADQKITYKEEFINRLKTFCEFEIYFYKKDTSKTYKDITDETCIYGIKCIIDALEE